MVKENIRRIAVTGVHKLDIVLYLSFILQKLEFKVLVCDRTAAGEMKPCIRKPEKAMALVSYQEIDFAFSELAALEEEYDYIFYVQDFAGILDCRVHKHIFICDEARKNLGLLVQELNRIRWSDRRREDCMVVYRDMYSSCGIEYVKERCAAVRDMEVEILQHECMDEASYLRMQLQPYFSLPELSSGMEGCLREILCKNTGLEERLIRRGIKLARKGRAY